MRKDAEYLLYKHIIIHIQVFPDYYYSCKLSVIKKLTRFTKRTTHTVSQNINLIIVTFKGITIKEYLETF